MALEINIPRYGNTQIVANTFDELRSLSSKRIEEGYSAIVAGADAPADHFGGMLVWNASATTPDDNRTVIAPADGQPGRWLKIAVGEVGPKGDSITGPKGDTGLQGPQGPAGIGLTAQEVAARSIVANGLQDNTAALQALVTAGDLRIVRQAAAYVLSAPIVLPAGRTIVIEANTAFKWTGGAFNGGAFIMANDFALRCEGEFTMTSTTSTQGSIAAGYSVQNVIIEGAFGINMTQAYFECSTAGTKYDDVVTTTMVAKGDTRAVTTNRNITIIRGGCSFSGVRGGGRAGAFLIWCEDWEVRDTRYEGSQFGIQYWGGDSGTASFQDIGRLGPNIERKNTLGRMTNIVTRRTVAGLWGSMGRDIKVTNCRVYDCTDVGHDHEGSWNVTVQGSHAEDCVNGGYTTFSYVKRILFADCTGRTSNKAWPLFRIYNVSQSQVNEDITVQGGLWECTDTTGPSTMDSGYGPARSISIMGANFANVILAFATLNNCRIAIKDNVLEFPYVPSAAFTAIAAGGVTTGGYGNPEVYVNGNTIVQTNNTPAPSGTIAILATAGDFNSAPGLIVSNNSIWLPNASAYSPIRFANTGQNGGLAGTYVAFGNRTDGQIQTTDAGAASKGNYFARQNYTSINADVGLTAI